MVSLQILKKIRVNTYSYSLKSQLPCNISSTGFKSLTDGQKVKFTIIQGKKGPQTEDLIVL